MAKRYTRQELLDLVWSGPMRTIAAEVGVSDVGLRKACLKAGVPIPPQGYWNQVRAGKRVLQKPDLPPRGFGASNDVWFGAKYWQRRYVPQSDEPLPPPPTFGEPSDAVRKRAQQSLERVSVPRDLAIPRPAIRQILDDEAARAEKARTSKWPPSVDQPRFNTSVDQRRLRILNALATVLATEDVRANLLSKEGPVIHLSSGDIWLPIIVTKTTWKGKSAEDKTRLTVILGVNPEHPSPPVREWKDEVGNKLERRIREMAVEILVALEERYRESELNHHRWIVERRAAEEAERRKARLEAERAERERQEKMRRDRIERLLSDATRSRQAADIRAYVADVIMRNSSGPSSIDAKTLTAWRAWALNQADLLDPAANGQFSRSIEDDVA